MLLSSNEGRKIWEGDRVSMAIKRLKMKNKFIFFTHQLATLTLCCYLLMYSPPWIVIITAIHLLRSTSSFFNTITNFSRCNHPLEYSNSPGEKDTTTTSSEEWHYIPRDILLNNRDNQDIARGCDAIVNKLNINDNTLDQYIWARTFQSQYANIRYDIQNDDTSILHSHNDTSTVPPLEAIKAIEATHRWSENFVRQLSLCPWAGSSLDTVGAIRYWVLLVDDINDDIQNNKIILDTMEDLSLIHI